MKREEINKDFKKVVKMWCWNCDKFFQIKVHWREEKLRAECPDCKAILYTVKETKKIFDKPNRLKGGKHEANKIMDGT